jgi:hypothetical protein
VKVKKGISEDKHDEQDLKQRLDKPEKAILTPHCWSALGLFEFRRIHDDHPAVFLISFISSIFAKYLIGLFMVTERILPRIPESHFRTIEKLIKALKNVDNRERSGLAVPPLLGEAPGFRHRLA